MSEQHVCSTDELDEGDRIIVEFGGREVAVFNVHGEFVAVANYCVHAGGPICEGKVSGTVTASPDTWEYDWEREGEILACPWHGWEFDLVSGEHLSDSKYKLVTYDIDVRDGEVFVVTGADASSETGLSSGDSSA